MAPWTRARKSSTRQSESSIIWNDVTGCYLSLFRGHPHCGRLTSTFPPDEMLLVGTPASHCEVLFQRLSLSTTGIHNVSRHLPWLTDGRDLLYDSIKIWFFSSCLCACTKTHMDFPPLVLELNCERGNQLVLQCLLGRVVTLSCVRMLEVFPVLSKASFTYHYVFLSDE